MREWYRKYREGRSGGSNKIKFIIVMVALNLLLLYFFILPKIKEIKNPPQIEILNKKLTTDLASRSKDFSNYDFDEKPEEITYYIKSDLYNKGGNGDVVLTGFLEKSDSTYIVEEEIYIRAGDTVSTELEIGPVPYGDGKRIYYLKAESEIVIKRRSNEK